MTKQFGECPMFMVLGNCLNPECKLTHEIPEPPKPIKKLKYKLTSESFVIGGTHTSTEKTKMKSTSNSFNPNSPLASEENLLQSLETQVPHQQSFSNFQEPSDLLDNLSQSQSYPVQYQQYMGAQPSFNSYMYPAIDPYNNQANMYHSPEYVEGGYSGFYNDSGVGLDDYWQVNGQNNSLDPSSCTCCNGNPQDCSNQQICIDMGHCFCLFDEDDEDYENDNFNEKFKDCNCCGGYTYQCTGDICVELGVCQCVMSNEMEEQTEMNSQIVDECKSCPCCKGFAYRCPQKLDNCREGSCGCIE